MLKGLDYLREFSLLSVTIRMLLAVICGGLIGLERERKRRPAGFRTHIMICIGAAMTMLTSQYLCVCMNYYTDMTRIGAQVVAGIGFIGAGTIIVTKRRRVKGLTTAAGLWAAAIVGLACGAGFYEGAVCATILILVTELVFVKVENQITRNAREAIVYVEYSGRECLERILRCLQDQSVKVSDLEITKNDGGQHNTCAIFTLQLSRRRSCDAVVNRIMEVGGVGTVEEL